MDYVDTNSIRTASMAFGQAAVDCENQLRNVDSTMQHLLSAWEGSAQVTFRNAYEAWKKDIEAYIVLNYLIGGELDRMTRVFEQYNHEVRAALSAANG
ncbi:MAG: WXG100 family type VII secretion target [Thermomicrobiales bacterium]|nr:WXG100 family type VII secretion target [Thermomicrobiales bacterium]